MSKHLKASLLLTGLTLVICCVLYPAVLMGIGWTLFPNKVEGSPDSSKGQRRQGANRRLQPGRSAVQAGTEYFLPRLRVRLITRRPPPVQLGASQPKLRDRVAQQLGRIHSVSQRQRLSRHGRRTGARRSKTSPPGSPAKPDRAADWANEYSVPATNWAKTDLAKDKYGLQGEFILEWAKKYPEILADWKKANPDKDDPKPEDIVGPFFTKFAEVHPGKWPGVVEAKQMDGTVVKRIEPVAADAESSIAIEFLRHVASRSGQRRQGCRSGSRPRGTW